MIPNPVKIGFNPKTCEEATQTIFDNQTARTLYLAWKSTHVVSQFFVFDCWASAKRISRLQPTLTENDLCACLRGPDFESSEVVAWAGEALKFFNGEELKFEINR